MPVVVPFVSLPSRRTPSSKAKTPALSQPALDTESLRLSLAHKLARFARDWKRCARPACARHRRCAAALPCKAAMPCRAPAPLRIPSPAQHARVMRALQRALMQALAARRAQDGDGVS